ncbi:polymerase, partial [Enterobacter hormaechei]
IGVALRAIRSTNNEQKNIGFSFLMVLSWLFAHGFGENFGLIGEQHQMIVLAVMLGLCLAANLPINRHNRVQE